MSVAGIKQITKPVDVLDATVLNKKLAELGSLRSKADAIVSHMTKALNSIGMKIRLIMITFPKELKILWKNIKTVL